MLVGSQVTVSAVETSMIGCWGQRGQGCSSLLWWNLGSSGTEGGGRPQGTPRVSHGSLGGMFPGVNTQPYLCEQESRAAITAAAAAAAAAAVAAATATS